MPVPGERNFRLILCGRALVLTAALGLCSCTSPGVNAPRELTAQQGVQLIPDTPQQIAPQVADAGYGGIQQIGWQSPSAPGRAAVRTEFSPNEPRQIVPTQLVTHETSAEDLQDERAERYPDEYLFDGGDRGLPFHYENLVESGLESEDAIAEYTDHTGESHMKPTTRVAIYSPQFASVTTVSMPQQESAMQTIVSADKTVQTYDMKSQMGTQYHNEYLRSGGLNMRSRASGLESEFETHGLDQVTVAGRNDKLLNVFQSVAFLTSGRIDNREAAIVAKFRDNAITWSQNVHAVLTASTQGGMELRTEARPEEYVGLEDWRKTKGDLRIVKLADKKILDPAAADASDREVVFTFRYDNLGDFELKDLRIVDNLIGRLEFLPDSVEATGLDVSVETADNGEGGTVLIFNLDGELKGHTGGTVSFKARLK